MLFLALTKNPIVLRGQSSEIDKKYLTVIVYLQTNEMINDEIKKVFYKNPKKQKCGIDFNVSNRIDYLGIEYFEELLKPEHGVSKESINVYGRYKEKYYFESYEIEELNSLIPERELDLFLTFSKPIDDYLVVEISSFNPKDYQDHKFGLAMQFFFKFDSSGIIIDVVQTVNAYN